MQNGLEDISIYHGSVNEMPFNNKSYDGIYSHALLHLLNKQEREQFIKGCYNQLKSGGYMVFTTVSKSPNVWEGKQLDKDYFEIMEGVKMFFYNSESIKRDFNKYGLVQVSEIDEPNKNMENKPSINFLMIKCQKEL